MDETTMANADLQQPNNSAQNLLSDNLSNSQRSKSFNMVSLNLKNR